MSDIRKYIRLIESQETTLSSFVDDNKHTLPIRLKGYLDTYYDGNIESENTTKDVRSVSNIMTKLIGTLSSIK